MKEAVKTDFEFEQDAGETIDLLLVDDDLSFLNLASRQFEEHSNVIRPRTCDNPERALEILEKENIDCILSDFKMPEMNGIELLKRVKARHPDLPFIILTSEGSEEIASNAISSGVTDYIKKGSSTEEYQLIINRIENAVLKNRAENRRKQEQIRYERTLKALQDVSRELLDAKDRDEALQMVLDAATNILDLPGAGVYLFNQEKEQLEPVANTRYLKDIFGETLPPLDGNDNSIAWRCFSNNETINEEDIRDIEKYTDDVPIRSGIWTPIGDKGVLAVLSEQIGDFDQRDCQLTELLASSTETALERLEKEEKLEESKNRYKTLVENLPNGSVALFDQDLRFQTVRGETIDRAYGSPDKIEGKTIYEMYEGEALEKIEKAFKSALNGEKSETKINTNNMDLKLHTAPLKDESGNIISGLSVSQNITGRKERENELELYETIIETINDGVYLINDEGRFKLVNSAYCEMTGFSKEELIGEPATKVVSDEIAEKAREKLENLEEGESTSLEAEMKTADGRKMVGESNFTALTNEEGEKIGKIGVVRDVTRQRELEEKLRKTQRDSEAIARSMIDAVEEYAIFRLDTEGNVVSWNEGAKEIKRYNEDEIIGKHFSNFYTEEDKENGRPEKNLEEARKNGRTRDQGWRVRKDGSKFWADVTITAIRDENGELTGFTKVTEDMTEQRQRREKMKEQLEEFSSIVSHDLKNPLEIAKGYVDLAKDSKDEEDLEKAETALDRMGQIIEDTRIITMRPKNLNTGEVSLKSVFEESYDITERAGSEKAEYKVEDLKLQGNRSSLVRLFSNLIKNSIDHNTEKVELRAGPMEDGFYYEDTGKGISGDSRRKVLEHGFTTSDSGRGLGMYIVKRIANLHGWDIEIKDSEEGGARFEFHF